MRVTNTQDLSAIAVKMVVAGEAGNGKTTLARTLVEGLKGEGVILISAEAGTLSLRGVDIDTVDLQTDDAGVAVPQERRLNRLAEIYKWLLLPEQMKRYAWVFMDSLTEINQNVLTWLESQEDFQGPKNTIKKYGELSTQMRRLCKLFRDMPHYNVVFSALVKTDKNSDGVEKMKVDMTGKFADQLPALFDEILYLGVTSEIDPATNKNVRLLLTQKTDRIDFPKDRSGALDRTEPADLSHVARKIRGKVKEQVADSLQPGVTVKVSIPVPIAEAPLPEPVIADISKTAKAAAAEAKLAKETH